MDLHILLDPVSDFWKCPKKGFKKNDFLPFFTTFFDIFGLIRSIKNFFKSPGSQHECRPIYGLCFVYIDLLSFI